MGKSLIVACTWQTWEKTATTTQEKERERGNVVKYIPSLNGSRLSRERSLLVIQLECTHCKARHFVVTVSSVGNL